MARSDTIVLVGMPGAGKSCVGKRLAERLGLPFADSDAEVEAAAGMAVSDIFSALGEEAFRDGERRVIARLLEGGPLVLATGGGAFASAATRDLIRERGVSVWLRADLDLLCKRVSRHDHRPLLKGGDVREKLAVLLENREKHYAQANVIIDSDNSPADAAVDRVLSALAKFIGAEKSHGQN